MQIDSKQMDERPKKVGELHGRPVMHLRTKGGLHIMAKANGEVLGTGPHRAVARHIAQKHEPEIVWTELSKSDHITPDSFALVLPKYEEQTEALRTLQAARRQ